MIFNSRMAIFPGKNRQYSTLSSAWLMMVDSYTVKYEKVKFCRLVYVHALCTWNHVRFHSLGMFRYSLCKRCILMCFKTDSSGCIQTAKMENVVFKPTELPFFTYHMSMPCIQNTLWWSRSMACI